MADDGDDDTTATKQPDKETDCEAGKAEAKAGWLLKRTKMSRKWKRKWFVLEEKAVVYGNSPEELSKSILLDKCEITSCEVSEKPYTFYLKPQDTQRKHFISAESETESQEWMQAICLAKASGQQNSEGTQACVLQ